MVFLFEPGITNEKLNISIYLCMVSDSVIVGIVGSWLISGSLLALTRDAMAT